MSRAYGWNAKLLIAEEKEYGVLPEDGYIQAPFISSTLDSEQNLEKVPQFISEKVNQDVYRSHAPSRSIYLLCQRQNVCARCPFRLRFEYQARSPA